MNQYVAALLRGFGFGFLLVLLLLLIAAIPAVGRLIEGLLA